MLYLVTNHRDVPQKHENSKEEGSDEGPSKHDLDALGKEPFNHAVHHLPKVEHMRGAGRDAHAVDVARATGEAIGHVYFMP